MLLFQQYKHKHTCLYYKQHVITKIQKMSKILLAFILFGCALGLYNDNSPVFKLTQKNFKSLVLESDQFWFVEFYAPWCGHCKMAAPQFQQAASILSGIVNVGAVDMTTDPAAGSRYGIQGYPTIKLFAGDKNKPIDFSSSQRTFSKFVEFCMTHLKKQVATRKKNLEKQKAQEL